MSHLAVLATATIACSAAKDVRRGKPHEINFPPSLAIDLVNSDDAGHRFGRLKID